MSKRDMLLNYLQKNTSWHTSQNLAIQFGVSKRTIKNYISDLKHSNFKIESSSKGYRLVIKGTNINSLKSLPNTQNERVNFIINHLINKSSKLNSYDLALKLFVSESTILQDLKLVAKKVNRFNIQLNRSGDYWYLCGDEREKRRLLSSLIYEETNGTFMNRSIIQSNFPNINVSELKTIILKICNDDNIFLNTFDLNNVLLHFAIVISRLKSGYIIKVDNVSQHIKNRQYIDELSSKIIQKVEEKLGVNIEIPDQIELALILQSSISKSNKIENKISKETKELVNDLISYVWKNYSINLESSGFRDRFSLHLDRLIDRAKNKRPEHNPITSNIKISSPTIYECAVIIAHRISEKINIKIEDSEIAYIALHIGNEIAEQLVDKQKISVLILIPQYYDNSAILSKKLEKEFFSSINIKGIINDPSQIKNYGHKIDLLVAVNSNYNDNSISTVSISQFFVTADIQKLYIAITTKQHQLKKTKFQAQLLQFFDSSNFIKTIKINNYKQAFNIISEKFEKQGIVKSDFKKLLYQREKMSSTAFGRIAIPHSLDMTSRKSQGFILINPKGIKWSNGKEVYLVIALAIDPLNKQLFRNVFDELSDIVTDINNVTQLINCKKYSEFIIKLVDLL